MTADALKKDALRRLRLSPKLGAEQLADADKAAELVLTPYRQRDSATFDGKGSGEKWDPELKKMVVIQVSDLRQKTPPYQFRPDAVRWLEREIRRRIGV